MKLAASGRSQSSNVSLFSYLRRRPNYWRCFVADWEAFSTVILVHTIEIPVTPYRWCEAVVCTASGGQLQPWHGCPQILPMLDAASFLSPKTASIPLAHAWP